MLPSAQPTSVPSAQPSRQPSTLPTAQPSSAPSGQPTGQPTTQPTDRPTSRPTAQPSRTPSTQPSRQPTRQPSAQPSRQPIARPTSQPSRQPTSHPTSQPTAYRTTRFIYSRAPSAAPTLSPTLSELAVWSNLLQDTLRQASANDSSSGVVHRATYYELDVQSVAPARRYGGCAAWASTLYGDVNPSQYTYKPQSIRITAAVDGTTYDRIESAASSVVECVDPTATSSIISALLLASRQQMIATRTVLCGASNWVVAQCTTSAGYAAAVCVDCSDPCSPTLQCNNNGLSASASGLVVAPCVSQLCTGTSQGASLTPATALRVLTVGFTDIERPPNVLSVQTLPAKTSVRVVAQLSSAGSVSCAVFKSTAAVSSPATLSAVTLQNLAATTDAMNNTIVDISGLLPATEYNLFLLPTSRIGVQATLADVLASAVRVTTNCCKSVTATLSTVSVPEKQSVSNLLTLSLDALPSTSIIVKAQLLTVVSGAATTNSYALFPAEFTVTSLSPTIAFKASLPALPAGVYQVEISVVGDAAAEYDIAYANSQRTITVLSPLSEPAVPVLYAPVFANDGSYVSIAFSGATNKGGIIANTFACSTLFSFTCASTSKCQWMDPSTVRAYIQGSTASAICAAPNATLSLAPAALIKAWCSLSNDGCPNYAQWQTVSTSTVVRILPPVKAITPTVAISAPAVLGYCADLQLDVTASTGSGGRPWSSATFTVLSAQGTDTSELAQALRLISVVSPPPNLAARLFRPGQTYNFVLKLCNFLGQCGIGSKQVLMLNDTLPAVSLPGAALRTVSRKDALFLASTAYVTTCDGGRSSAGLTYTWTLFSDRVQILDKLSTSRDPAKYLLPAYTLTAGVFYRILLSISAVGSAQSSEVSVQVYVQPGNVVAAVSGGLTRSVRVSDTLTLDASGSRDEDIPTATGLAAGLRFTWICTQSAPTFNSSCAAAVDMVSFAATARSPLLTVVPRSYGATLQIAVEVSDATGTRSSSALVVVDLLPDLAPVVSVTAPNVPASSVINAGQLLQLRGTLSVPALYGGNGSWAVDDSSIDLSSIGLFAPTVAVAGNTSAAIGAVTSMVTYMAIPANTLPVGATLTFTLTGRIPFEGKSAIGGITITINAPPTSGTFYVDPAIGVELSQTFRFVALQWVDGELPLTYQFSYLANTGTDVVLRSRLELPYGSSLLPAGDDSVDNAVISVAQVYDAVNANTSAQFTTVVTKDTTLNATEVDAFVRSQLLAASADADAIKQATALSSYLLNAVNCTLAPNCTSLNRRACASTPHTCGPCLTALYIGEEGDSNSQCIVLPRQRQLHGTRAGYMSRRLLLTDEVKPCAGNCSGHGACTHQQRDSGAILDDTMPPCFVGAVDCVAVCYCDDGYMGLACELTAEEFALRQSGRAQVIAGLQTLVELENPDEQVMTGWVNSLAQATQISAELTTESGVTALQLVDSITAAATSSGALSVSDAALAGLLQTVDAVVAADMAKRRRRLSAERRGLTATEDNSYSGVGTSTAVLNNLGAALSANMLPGQKAAEYTQDQFRLSVQVGTSTGDSEMSVTVPQTALESFLGVQASAVQLPVAEGVAVVVTSLASSVMQSVVGDALLSNALTVYSAGEVCTSPPCKTTVVMQNTAAVDYSALNGDNDAVFHSLTCGDDDYSSTVFACPQDTTLEVHCNGTAGVVTQQCPITRYAGGCNSLALGGTDAGLQSGQESGCVVLSYTDTHVTCECDYYKLRSASRRLATVSTAGYNFTQPEGYSVSYVAMLQATTDSFLSTIKTADDLNASTVTKGWRALATLGALAIGIAFIAFSLAWSHNADFQKKKVIPVSAEDAKDTVDKASMVLKAAKAGKDSQAVSKHKGKLGNRSKKVLLNAELAIVEESLPRALSSRTFTDRFLEEVKQHHRWFAIVFYYSEAFPRVLRVTSLATNAIVMLFIQSITYNLTNPDDGTCEALRTEVACLQPQSPFATGESKCAWVATSATEHACVYVEPDQSVRIILFVAIFCAIVTTPIALAADWIILNVLSARTKVDTPEVTAAVGILASTTLTVASDVNHDDDKVSDTRTAQDPRRDTMLARKSSSTQLREYFSLFTNELKAQEDKQLLAKSRAQLVALSTKLRSFRATLQPDQLQEFDTLWGLDSEGNFLTQAAEAQSALARVKRLVFKPEQVNVKEAVLMDLKRINEAVLLEERQLTANNAANKEIGRKLLFLFQCDLLPGICGKILEAKSSRDSSAVGTVSYAAKIAGWMFLFLMNVGMLFYILLFALTQTGPRQNAWFQSFALWLVVEILLVSTGIVFVTHILIPSLVMKDLSQIKRRLLDNIREFNNKVQEAKERSVETVDEGLQSTFNAANFLFVSTRLAKLFPNLKESKIIAQFSTPWPRQSYLHVDNTSKKYSKKFTAVTRSASILLIFFVGNFLSVPPSIQDMVVQMTSTTAIGYIVLVHVQLYELFPVLVILPALLVVALGHFIVQSSKADAKLRLARLFPAVGRSARVQPSPAAANYAVDAADEEVDQRETTRTALYADDEGEEYKLSDSDSDVDVDAIVTRAAPVAGHQTRRQSVQAGLDLLQTMRNHSARRQSDGVMSVILSSESDNDSDSEHSQGLSQVEVELHRPVNTRRSVPMILQRSMQSRGSVDLSSVSAISSGGSRARGPAEVGTEHSRRASSENSEDECSVSTSECSSSGTDSEREAPAVLEATQHVVAQQLQPPAVSLEAEAASGLFGAPKESSLSHTVVLPAQVQVQQPTTADTMGAIKAPRPNNAEALNRAVPESSGYEPSISASVPRPNTGCLPPSLHEDLPYLSVRISTASDSGSYDSDEHSGSYYSGEEPDSDTEISAPTPPTGGNSEGSYQMVAVNSDEPLPNLSHGRADADGGGGDSVQESSDGDDLSGESESDTDSSDEGCAYESEVDEEGPVASAAHSSDGYNTVSDLSAEDSGELSSNAAPNESLPRRMADIAVEYDAVSEPDSVDGERNAADQALKGSALTSAVIAQSAGPKHRPKVARRTPSYAAPTVASQKPVEGSVRAKVKGTASKGPNRK
jgi:hypothetical protein